MPDRAALARRRRIVLGGLAAIAATGSGCVGLAPRDPVHVHVVGIDPLPGQGMEGRFAVRLRVQNPSDAALEFDGVALELEVAGNTLATGVSDQRGTVARFGESIFSVPVTMPATAIVRQALRLASGDSSRVSYRLKGRLGGTTLAGTGARLPGSRFDASGEIDLAGLLGERSAR